MSVYWLPADHNRRDRDGQSWRVILMTMLHSRTNCLEPLPYLPFLGPKEAVFSIPRARAFAGPRDLQALVPPAITLACELFRADRRPAIKSLVLHFPESLSDRTMDHSPCPRHAYKAQPAWQVRTKPYKALEPLDPPRKCATSTRSKHWVSCPPSAS